VPRALAARCLRVAAREVDEAVTEILGRIPALDARLTLFDGMVPAAQAALAGLDRAVAEARDALAAAADGGLPGAGEAVLHRTLDDARAVAGALSAERRRCCAAAFAALEGDAALRESSARIGRAARDAAAAAAGPGRTRRSRTRSYG